MGRQENVEIFEDTLALCKQNSTLRNAIEQSTKKQKLYPEGIECAEKQAITYARPAQIIVSSKRTLEAAMLKAIRSLEIGLTHLEMPELKELSDEEIRARISKIDDERIFVVAEALRRGVSLEEIHEITMIDRWFLQKILNIVKMETVLKTEPMTKEIMRKAKRMGFADVVIGEYIGKQMMEVRAMRKDWGIIPTYKMVDTLSLIHI